MKKENKMTIVYKIQEPKPIVLEGFERKNSIITPKKMFFVKYDNYLGYLYLETGERLVLSPLRLGVVEQLVEAVKKGVPYVAGKDLLYKAGSEQFCLVNLFWSSPNWRNFIESTSRGFYRLKLYADTTFEDYIQVYANDNKKSA